MFIFSVTTIFAFWKASFHYEGRISPPEVDKWYKPITLTKQGVKSE